eukprot:15006-Eustigmatos_ZCMA.PRE.1
MGVEEAKGLMQMIANDVADLRLRPQSLTVAEVRGVVEAAMGSVTRAISDMRDQTVDNNAALT